MTGTGRRLPSDKKTVFVRLLAFALLAVCLLPTVCACGEQAPDDAYLIERAAELLPQTTFFNELFFVEGLPIDDTRPAEGDYLWVRSSFFTDHGYDNIESIVDDMQRVYTAAYCDAFSRSSVFSAVAGENALAASAYCIDYYETTETGERVYHGSLVHRDGLTIETDRVTYHTDTLHVTFKSNISARVSLTVTVTDREGRSQEREMSVTLAPDNGTWKIDSNTCMTYREESYPLPD